jgi:hypothetical protein
MLGRHIDDLEMKYLYNEPDLILLGDFNLPLERAMNKNVGEQNRAGELSEYFSSLGLIDCWKSNDDRITHRGGQSRLDRILYRLNGNFIEKLQTDWTFTTSDHCLLILKLVREENQNKKYNRRITSLPTYILNYKDDLEAIKKGMEEFHSMIDENWEASTKLEFLKT